MGGDAIDRWALKNLIVKALKVARDAGKGEMDQAKCAAAALLMKHPEMSGSEAIDWVERLASPLLVSRDRRP